MKIEFKYDFLKTIISYICNDNELNTNVSTTVMLFQFTSVGGDDSSQWWIFLLLLTVHYIWRSVYIQSSLCEQTVEKGGLLLTRDASSVNNSQIDYYCTNLYLQT